MATRNAGGPPHGRASRTHHTTADAPPPSSAPSSCTPYSFGLPSNYSLPGWELARHVRQLRRQGWQPWEIRARFDFWSAA